MTHPEEEKVRVVVKRRRTSRHRRNRRIRRAALALLVAFFTAGASSIALRHISPSLFRASTAAPVTFEQAEESRDHLLAIDQEIQQFNRSASRPVYPYSVVPGGIDDAKELKWVAEHDPVVASHYAGFDYDHARVVRLTLAKTVYLSYRIGNHVYWTRHRVTLHKGEKLITDGRMTGRTKCANRVEEVPQQATSRSEPPVEKFDQPGRGDGTAMENPPVPFQSALLNRPLVPGAHPGPPLSLYSPFTGANWLALSPPPLPSDVCAPKKKGESGVTVETGNGKKKSVCGSGGTSPVPEPGTWLLMITGMAGIYWQVRRRLIHS